MGTRLARVALANESPGPRLSITVFVALLVAALLHAGWNALVRRDPDRDGATAAIAAGGAALGLVLAPLLPAIAPEAIPYILGSSLIHVVYYALIARAYRHGELSVCYPIMRGLAPLIVTLVAVVFVEPAAPAVLAGIVVVAVGIVSLGIDGFRSGRGGLAAAIGNSVVIAAYTLVDGLGARASQSPAAYVAWILIGSGVATLVWRLATRRRLTITQLGSRLPLAAVGGSMGYAAYGIALWAMTLAPIGAVAAVRESSVLLATAIGAIVLKERFGRLRWLAAGLVVVGLAMVKLGAPG